MNKEQQVIVSQNKDNINYWVIKKRPQGMLDQLIAGKTNWTLDRARDGKKPKYIDRIKENDFFLIYNSQHKFRVFRAVGFLGKKQENKELNAFLLTFKKLSGEKGFTGLKNYVDLDEKAHKIRWKPSEGSIQPISKKAFGTILEKSGIDIEVETRKNKKKPLKTIPTITQIAESSTKAIEIAKKYESAENRRFDDVSDKVCGYDISSKNKQKAEIRYIEVKARKANFPLALTSNEYETAQKLGKKYFVYVVTENGLSDIIQDPANTCKCQEISVVNWRLVDWKEKSQKLNKKIEGSRTLDV